MPKVSLLPSATAANLTGAAVCVSDDKNTLTVGTTYAQLRTALLAQGTGYATTDVLNVGSGGIGDSLANLVLTLSGASSIATLTFQQVTARIVGGSTNGLAIRNSANARDNAVINDAGSSLTLYDGTHQVVINNVAAAGECVAGTLLTSGQAFGTNILTSNNTAAGLKLVLAYYDGAQNRSALEVQNAAGFGTLALMKSGGDVLVGPATATATNATQGFVYISTCAGAPTGTPALSSAGQTPQIYDTTNHKIWFYDHGTSTWKGVAVA